MTEVHKYILVSLFLFPITVSAQLFHPSVDSLRHQLTHHTEQDTIRIRLLLELGYALTLKEEWRNSLPYLLEAEGLSFNLKHIPFCIYTCESLFTSYYELGILDSAEIYVNRQLANAQKIKHLEAEMDGWNNLALLYSYKLVQDSAHMAYEKAFELAVQLDLKDAQATFSSNMGILFGEQRQYEKARQYFRQAYHIGLERPDTALIALGSMNLARSFIEEEEFDSAGYYLAIAQVFAEHCFKMDPSLYTSVSDFLGLLALKRRNFSHAKAKYKELENIYKNGEQKVLLAGVYSRLAEIAFTQEEHEEAINYALLNLNLLENVPAEQARENTYLILTQAYGKIEDYQAAHQYGELYRQLRDSFYNQEVTRIVNESNSEFEIAKKETENAQLKLKAQTQTTVARQQTIYTLMATIIAILIGCTLLVYFLEYKRKKKLNAQLEIDVQERTMELQETNAKLQKYVDELRTFGYMTSHDLKEPLRNISGFVSLLEKKFNGNLDAAGKEFMSYIKLNTIQMHELIEDILTYSTLDDQPSRIKPTDLNGLIDKVAYNLDTLIKEKNAIIQCEDLPKIPLDSANVSMILKNLIENGIKYNQSALPCIKISYQSNKHLHQINIEDNGIGIPTEYQSQIFQLFKRLHSRSEYSGTGMGLAISQKIAARLGGNIHIQSNEEQGSIFTLQLPIT